MGMQTGWFGHGNLWTTWNDWFSRLLICPSSSHPITGPNDDRIIISPADSVPQGVWDIDNSSKIDVEGGLRVKLLTYYMNKILYPFTILFFSYLFLFEIYP